MPRCKEYVTVYTEQRYSSQKRMTTYAISFGSRNIVVYKQTTLTYDGYTYYSYDIVHVMNNKITPYRLRRLR